MANDTSAGSRWQRIQVKVGARLAQQLFADVSRERIRVEPRHAMDVSLTLGAAIALAGVIFLANLALALTGFALIGSTGGGVASVVFGVICILLALLSFPKPTRKPSRVISRADYPTIHLLADRIAGSLGTRSVYGIGASPEFNANYRSAGWQGQRYVEFGTALAAVLTADEFIALFAHELSHGANGDPLRGRFLGGALDTIVHWALVIRPASLTRPADGFGHGPLVSLVTIPFATAALGISELLLLVARGFYLMLARESQRAEYLADLLAAKVAGSRNMMALLEKLHLFNFVDTAIQRHALNSPDLPIQQVLFESVRDVPHTRLESLRAESRAANWQVDGTHPPTAMRIDMIEAHEQMPPSTVLSEHERNALAEEIAKLVESLRRVMVADKVEAMYV